MAVCSRWAVMGRDGWNFSVGVGTEAVSVPGLQFSSWLGLGDGFFHPSPLTLDHLVNRSIAGEFQIHNS